MKKSVLTLLIVFIAFSFLFTGCSKKEAAVSEEKEVKTIVIQGAFVDEEAFRFEECLVWMMLLLNG